MYLYVTISGKEFGNFVFVCSSENENKSNLISALDTYRKRKISRYNQNEEMLRKKLCMEENSSSEEESTSKTFKKRAEDSSYYAAQVDDDL